MHDQSALSGMKLSELKEIARQLNLKKAETLKKQDLIAKILEEQSIREGRPKSIGPQFVGDDNALTEMATADEVLPVQDPEPAETLFAPDGANGHEEGDEENGDEDDEEEDDEEGEDDVERPAPVQPAAGTPVHRHEGQERRTRDEGGRCRSRDRSSRSRPQHV